MLRVTETNQDATRTTVKLEGKLIQPWVNEVRDFFANSDPSARPQLDLACLSFADEAGVDLLRQLIGRGHQIQACSPYVAELLHWRREQNC